MLEYVKIDVYSIPAGKRIEVALTYIYGIGLSRSKDIIKKLSLDPNLRVYELTDEQKKQIIDVVRSYKVGVKLKAEIMKNIYLYKKLGLKQSSKNIRGRSIANKKKVISKT